MIPLLLALTLSFSYPSFNAAPGCVDDFDYPLGDLGTVEVIFVERYHKDEEVLLVKDARGKQGLSESIILTLTRPGTIWLLFTDTSGNVSCPSNLVGVNLPVTSVPSSVVGLDEWFDIMGRRMYREPEMPGVYIHLTDRDTLKVVRLQ